ncbi:hypothetical protein EDB80DRAFT_683733 [Ilyonectria destructans]|nr:hypothetical protein EDB80DRAFT_683733 [Ilyonectria destructans]
MPLPSHAVVIALSACLSVLAVAVFIYLIVRYQDRRKNEELEGGSELNWDRWLTPMERTHGNTSEADLIDRPMTALQESSMHNNAGPILLKQLPVVMQRLHIAIYTFNLNKLLRVMAIDDPMHVVVPQVPHVVYSFYFNPVLMAVTQDGRLEEIVVTKFRSRSIDQFRAIESGRTIEADIDGIINESLSKYQNDMVDRIARPQEPVFEQQSVKSVLVKLTEEILRGGNSAIG